MYTQRNSRSSRHFSEIMRRVFIAAISAELRNRGPKPPLRRAVLMLGLLLIVSGCVVAVWSRRETPAAAQTRGETPRLNDEAARQSGVNPTGAPVGAMVMITGANFTGVTAVNFANNLTV